MKTWKLEPYTLIWSAFFPLQMNRNLAIGKSMRWWEKGLQPNMREIESAQDLVDSLANAGDRLVIVDFFSPGCGGCRALHPKVWTKRVLNLPLNVLFVWSENHWRDYCVLRNLSPCADLPVCGAEPRCAVLASELWGAQVYVLQPPCPCPTFLQVLQGSSGTSLQLQLHQRNCKILTRSAIHFHLFNIRVRVLLMSRNLFRAQFNFVL